MKTLSLVLAGMGLLASGCDAASSDHPPVLSPTSTNPVLCDRLSEPDSSTPVTAAGTFMVEGGEARCLADGQQCVLVWASAQCDAQVAVATCTAGLWLLGCWTLPAAGPDAAKDDAGEGGAPDASELDGSDAEDGDAAPGAP